MTPSSPYVNSNSVPSASSYENISPNYPDTGQGRSSYMESQYEPPARDAKETKVRSRGDEEIRFRRHPLERDDGSKRSKSRMGDNSGKKTKVTIHKVRNGKVVD